MKIAVSRKSTGIIFCIVAWMFCLSSLVTADDSHLFLPTAERIYGETLFAAAYRDALDGKVCSSVQKLDEALKYDPYLVSYYLLKGYCASLVGDYDKAAGSIRLYLEVKANDSFAKGFLKEVEDRKAFIEESLSAGITGKPVLSTSSGNFRRVSGMDVFRWPPSFSMPGRPAELGDILAMCDTSGEKIWIRKWDGRKWKRYYTGSSEGRIVRVLPVGGNSAVLVFADGRYSLGDFSRSGFTEKSKGRIGSGYVSDASFLGAGLLAVAERIPGKIYVIDLLTGKELYSWKPSSSPAFEPVSLASLGPLLAVADRSENRVFVLNLCGGEKMADFTIPGFLRGIEWLSSERLIALDESGRLFSLSLKSGKSFAIGGSFPEAWFLFKDRRGRVMVTDTRLYRYSTVSIESDKGFLALKYPKAVPDAERGCSYWMVDARVVRPLGTSGSVSSGERVFQGVLGGGVAEIKVTGISAAEDPLELAQLPDTSDEAFTSGPARQLLLRPENLPADKQSLASFCGYAFSNGIIVHILADRNLPSVEQLRFSEITGGRLILSKSQIPDLKTGLSYNLRVDLKPSIELPGDPRSSGLFVRARIGATAMEGRIPFWNAFLH